MMSTKKSSAMTCRTRLLTLLLCSVFVCCNVRHSAYIAQSENANLAVIASDAVNKEFGNSELLVQLQSEQGIEKPFAWWSWEGNEKGGTVIGIDHEGKLKVIEFVRTTSGYIFRSHEGKHELNVPIEKSGNLELRNYLSNTEFPFRSFIVSSGGCNAHFILVWHALNRSFGSRSREAVYLDAIDLRIIVEKDGAIIANKLEKLLFQSLDMTLAEDVNKDKQADFLLLGSNMSTAIRIWTLNEVCEVRQLLFKDGDRLLESLADRRLFVTKNQATGCYDVNVVHREPITKGERVFFEVTNTIYRWDRTDAVYKPAETSSKLEAPIR